ncbi:TonB-dependent receptor [Pelomonas sp. CA6]|uniref:TonB-dependent receptor n=1 Tax=Pelomonas sp. CA6 TaxID=2907999 RepID=UPI001F4C24BB|nr:TonB-dependent receptor [Pelomonas sp. CA6]MCH7344579.1 TonB-dependent receptor [Pelomonas sp. CA6]
MNQTSLRAGLRRAHTPLSLAALLACCALPAQAQSAEPATPPRDEPRAETARLDTVTVTARRREESLRDVPVAVTALGAAALETLNVKNLGDLQGQVPSLTIYAARGSNTTLTTFIRGVGQADPLWGVDPGVGIYLDDVYIARPQGALLEVFDTQRIEVLRGPQGTLYGKNTIGGAVKYVSRPLSTRTEGQITLAAGTHGQLNASGSLGGASADGQWRARIALAALKRDGYGKNLNDGSDVSDQDTKAGRVSLGFFPTAMPFTLQFSADDTRDRSHMRGFQRMAVNPFDPAKTPATTGRYDIDSGMDNANRTDSNGYALTATLRLSEAWNAKYIHAYRRSDTATAIDFDGLPSKIADVKASYKDHSRSNELQFSYDGGGSHSGVLGLYHFDGQAGGTVLNNFLNLSFGNTNGTVFTRGKAAYADWSWRLTPRLGLSAGLRYTQETKRAVVLNQAFSDASFSKPIATLSDFDKRLEVSNTAPKLALDYKLSGSTNLYATASRGFKSGGYNIRANVASVPDSAKPFKDEVLDSYELGAKMVLDQGRLEINTALFHNNYKNVQLSVFSSYTQPNGQPGFFGDFTNAGRATVDGGELEFVWRPHAAWTLSGNIAAVRAKYKEYLDRGVNVADQKKFSNTPKLQGALNLENRSAMPFGGTLRTRLGLSYRSKVYPTTDLNEILAQPGYALLSAGVIWDRDAHWSFALQGSNLTDKAYRTDGYNIPVLGVLSGYYGPPRQVTASASYRF